MKKSAEFKPIYIWAQAKDNESKDDFFEISNAGTKKIEDLDLIQRTVYEMNKVVEASYSAKNRSLKNKVLSYISKHVKDFESLSVNRKGEKVVLSFGTKDIDRAERASNIDVFLDLNNIDASNISEYVKYFYEGFMEFCNITDRHPFDLENINTTKFESILENNLLKKTLNSLPESIARNSTYLVIIFVILIFYIMIATR